MRALFRSPLFWVFVLLAAAAATAWTINARFSQMLRTRVRGAQTVPLDAGPVHATVDAGSAHR